MERVTQTVSVYNMCEPRGGGSAGCPKKDKRRERRGSREQKPFATKLEFLRGVQELAGWGGSFLMVHRNSAGRLGAGSIGVCLKTRWLGQKCGFYVPELYCITLGIPPMRIKRNQHGLPDFSGFVTLKLRLSWMSVHNHLYEMSVHNRRMSHDACVWRLNSHLWLARKLNWHLSRWLAIEEIWGATIDRLLKIIGLFCRILSLYRALLHSRPIILRSLLIVATPYAYHMIKRDPEN